MNQRSQSVPNFFLGRREVAGMGPAVAQWFRCGVHCPKYIYLLPLVIEWCKWTYINLESLSIQIGRVSLGFGTSRRNHTAWGLDGICVWGFTVDTRPNLFLSWTHGDI